jgi:hypothetical protein
MPAQTRESSKLCLADVLLGAELGYSWSRHNATEPPKSGLVTVQLRRGSMTPGHADHKRAWTGICHMHCIAVVPGDTNDDQPKPAVPTDVGHITVASLTAIFARKQAKHSAIAFVMGSSSCKAGIELVQHPLHKTHRCENGPKP